MTTTPETRSLTAPDDARDIPMDLPERVSAHMQTHFPEDVDAGGWTCARDYRDNTAVVVWRRCQDGDQLLPGGARATLLTRWHVSLQNAGFISVPRTDMEVFGRPSEQSPDGRARWLHVTGWAADLVVKPRTIPQLALELKQKLGVQPKHRVRIDPGQVPMLPRFMDGTLTPVHGLHFRYRPDGDVWVSVDYEHDSESYPDPPDWVLAIAEEHRGHGAGWDGDGWCHELQMRQAAS